GPLATKVRWIEDECLGQDHSQHSNGNIDVKNPAPTVVIREPSASHRPQHRSNHDAEGPERHRLSTFFRWKGFQKNRLRQGLQTPAAGALHYAASDEKAERRGEATQE